MKKTGKYLLIFLFCLPSIYAGENAYIKWGYSGDIGPANWGKLSPSFASCSEGKTQSPIDIGMTSEASPYELTLKYQAAPLSIVNDGETRLVINHVPAIINKGHAIQLNFPQEGSLETMIFGDKEYHLKEFHFHTPSETAINGVSQAMEIHFVHQSSDGQVAVLAVLVREGKANPILQNIIKNFPKDHGVNHLIKGARISPSGLMPKKLDYYHFAGSLTTPPCTEGLQWIVFPDTISASAEQIAAFKKAVGGDNARPVQPGYQREIFYSAR